MGNRLEDVSDKIRSGIPVGMREAIEAIEAIEEIEYQSALKAERDARKAKTLLGRLKKWVGWV